MTSQATANTVRYQGYPYVNPIVTDAPSLNPEEVAARNRWANLPKRQVGNGAASKKDEENPEPVIYIDVPEDGQSWVTDSRPHPAQTSSSAADKAAEDAPVVYIDIPENNGSEVSERREEEDEAAFVSETILYDPFKNRRIDLREESSAVSSAGSSSSGAGSSWSGRSGTRPAPPNSLDLMSPSSSGYSSMLSPTPNNGVPAFLSKEAYVYGRQPTPDDGFNLSPIPVGDYPYPPPAYSETDTRSVPPSATPVPESQSPTQAPQTASQEPPRTQVITITTPPATLGMPQPDRKFVCCQHCGTSVHTLLIRQNGPVTHLLAIFSLFFGCLLPLTFLIYCTDGCKYKNHYCPNCNQKIGYEIPVICQEMVYVS